MDRLLSECIVASARCALIKFVLKSWFHLRPAAAQRARLDSMHIIISENSVASHYVSDCRYLRRFDGRVRVAIVCVNACNSDSKRTCFSSCQLHSSVDSALGEKCISHSLRSEMTLRRRTHNWCWPAWERWLQAIAQLKLIRRRVLCSSFRFRPNYYK